MMKTRIKRLLTSQEQMSEALILNLFLAFSGGIYIAENVYLLRVRPLLPASLFLHINFWKKSLYRLQRLL